jgi:membrane-bound lytic murein transglycosylase D
MVIVMKLLLSFFLLLFLSACQTTSNLDVDEENATTDQATEQSTEDEFDDEEGLSHLLPPKDPNATTENDSALPGSYENIWLKLAEGFEFDVPENARVKKQRDYFLKHPKYLKQVSKRAEPFLYLIVEQIESRNLPLELALLPVVESTFDPFAYSQSHASGLWQFMPVTGDRFGLKQDWWYDGRRDVYKSTGAALKYMQILHDYLGEDWLYAFAAYNSGEGRVQRAVRANKKNNKPTDYWHLNLPRETQDYVPKLLALIDILRNHEKYGIELPFIANEQVLTYVDTDSQLDLAYAAELAELTVAEIQLINPAFNHWATSPDGPHKLLVPTQVAQQFNEKLAKTDKNKRISWTRYKVKSGDSLSVIAQKNNTTTNVLKQINEIDGSFIKIGQALLIPVASKSQQEYLYSQPQRFERQHAGIGNGKIKTTHTIVEGDTLWDISRRYKVGSKDIAKWNGMNTRQTLRLGQKLTIWKTAKTSKKANAIKTTHTIVEGDTLWDISLRYKVSSKDIAKWNGMNTRQTLRLGQKLTIWKTAETSKNAINTTHTVVEGDTLWDISLRYKVSSKDIAKWNGINTRQTLRLGQKLTIRKTAITNKKANTTRRVSYLVRSGDSLGKIALKFNVKTSDLVRWNELQNDKYIKPGQKLKVYVAVRNVPS